jgi:hypothetical protein
VEVPERQGDDQERYAEDGEFGRGVIAQGFDSEDHTCYEGDHQRDAAMEASRLGVGPGVHGAHDLAPVFGVGAVVLGGAVVADLGPCAVADETPLVVGLAAA